MVDLAGSGMVEQAWISALFPSVEHKGTAGTWLRPSTQYCIMFNPSVSKIVDVELSMKVLEKLTLCQKIPHENLTSIS